MKRQATTFCKSERRRENRALLTLALPLLGGQLAQTGNSFVDTVMAGQAGATELAGVAVGSSIWMPLYLFMLGILINATPVTARLLAANQPTAARETLRQALVLALLLSLLILLAIRSIDPLLPAIHVDPALIPTVKGYLYGIAFGVPAAAIFLVLRSYTEALGHTRPVLWISLAGLIINIPLNYVLIHGLFGLPRLGGAGCGWATSLSAWGMVALMLVYIKKQPIYQAFPLALGLPRPRLDVLLRLTRIGLPSGLSTLFEVSIFAVIALLISSLGPVITAGHQIALNITGMTFMIPLSLSLAATIRIGKARGSNNSRALKLSLRQAFVINTLLGIGSALFLLITHRWLPLVYSSHPEVTQLASHLLLFAAIYQISDAWQVMAMGCLRGFEDTTWSMIITLTVYWGVAIPTGYILGLTNWLGAASGPYGFWIGIIVGLTAAAILLQVRLRIILARHLKQMRSH